MSLQELLAVSAALFGIGVYGALSQQTFVMIMMGLELMLNAAILAAVALWSTSAGGSAKGQLLGYRGDWLPRWISSREPFS